MLHKYKILFSHILICLLVCSAIYLPLAATPFLRHDDYYYPTMTAVDNCRDNDDYSTHLGYGRIIQAELTRCALVPLSKKFISVQFVVFLRLIILFFVAIIAGLLSYSFRRLCSLSQTLSILLATLIITLPGYTVYIGNSWFVTIVPAMICVMASVLVLRADRVSGEIKEDFSHWKTMALSLFLLLITLFNYQVLALLFLVPPVAAMLFGDQKTMKQKRNIALLHLLIFGVGLVLYLILQKLVIKPTYQHFYPGNTFNMDYGEMTVLTKITSVLSGLVLCFKKLLTHSFNLWFVQSNPLPAYLIFGTIGGTIIFFVIIEGYRALRVHEFKLKALHFLQTSGLLFCLFLGLESPQLFYGDFFGFRITAHVSAMFVLLLVWSLRYIFQLLFERSFKKIFLTVVFIFTFVMSALAQYQSIRDYAFLSLSELDFLESMLNPLINKKVSTAIIIRPQGNTRVGGDEHGMLTSCFDNDYGLQGMVKYIYRRNKLDPDSLIFSKKFNGRIIVVNDLKSIQQNVNERTIIDMDVFLKTQVLPR